MISFLNPIFFLALILIPLYFILKKMQILVKPAFFITIYDFPLIKKQNTKILDSALAFSKVLFTIAFFLMVLALTKPVLFTSKKMFSGAGHSIMFVVDISPSMTIQDMGKDNRITVAKKLIHDFTNKNPGNSFGLSAFASSAALLIPPTIDTETFHKRLDSLTIGELGEDTALGMGLAVGTAQLTGIKGNSSYLVVLTDGENNAGEIHPHLVAEIIGKHNINLILIGIGKEGPGKMLYTNPNSHKIYSGTVNTIFNEQELREVAQTASGKYISAQTPEHLQSIFNDIDKKIQSNNIAFVSTFETALDIYFLIACCICFSFGLFIKYFLIRTFI